MSDKLRIDIMTLFPESVGHDVPEFWISAHTTSEIIPKTNTAVWTTHRMAAVAEC